jgi:non-heme chloroperoxidase
MNRVLTTNVQLSVLALALLAGGAACTHNSTSWHDPSKHRLQFVTVEDGVRLEVLDWGGSGRPVVLLAGSGNTAHVFDGFAEKLTDSYHVYGITRRGYGASSQPASGYTEQRLADDVLNVLDSLHLAAPVLVGHSLGGHELTALASSHPNRIAGLVYMDSGADPTFNWSPYQELRKKLPAAMNVQPSTAAYRSFQAYRDWQASNLGIAFPESELRNCFAAQPDGSMGRYTTPASVGDAIFAGMLKPDYSRIRVPVLAFYALPAPLKDQLQLYKPQNATEREAIEQVYAADVSFSKRSSHSLQGSVPGARIVELAGAKHHVFLSNEADVMRELRAFLAGLPRP